VSFAAHVVKRTTDELGLGIAILRSAKSAFAYGTAARRGFNAEARGRAEFEESDPRIAPRTSDILSGN
jgi:hypothetical protein